MTQPFLLWKGCCWILLTWRRRMHLCYWFRSVLISQALLYSILLFHAYVAIPANRLEITETHFDSVYLRERPKWPWIASTSCSSAASSAHPAPTSTVVLQSSWRFRKPLVVFRSGWATEQTAQSSTKPPFPGWRPCGQVEENKSRWQLGDHRTSRQECKNRAPDRRQGKCFDGLAVLKPFKEKPQSWSERYVLSSAKTLYSWHQVL